MILCRNKFKLTRETPSAVHTKPEEHNERTEHTSVYSSSWATLQQRSSSRWLWSRYSSTTMSTVCVITARRAWELERSKCQASGDNSKCGHLLPVPGDQAPTRHDFAECWPAAVGTIVVMVCSGVQVMLTLLHENNII